jgi:branched-chain amino acid aminotransferase
MINYNGNLVSQAAVNIQDNRAFLYGDAIFETMKVLDGKILFAEDHYFRLMASMRIVRMEIPMHFTQEYMEEQVSRLANEMRIANSCRVRLSFFRKEGGNYLPKDNNAEFIITATALQDMVYPVYNNDYEVDLFKDFYVTKQLLSTLKSANRLVQVTGSIYADENGLDNCILLNDEKNVAEALQGNIFMLTGTKLVTPPVADGCLNGIMRKQVLAIARNMENIELQETSISPFDLQKADELFITNVIMGIRPVTKYRKKIYDTKFSQELTKKLNAKVRLG